MKCPVCSSNNTESDESGFRFVGSGNTERRWVCNDCESKWRESGLYFADHDIQVWDKKALDIMPSEQGEQLLAAKQDDERLKQAEQLTAPMFPTK